MKSGTFKSDISGTFVSDTSGTFGVIYSPTAKQHRPERAGGGHQDVGPGREPLHLFR